MKKLLLFLLFPLLALTACDDDDDSYSLGKFWINIATVENSGNGSAFYLKLDNGTRLWVGATNYYNYRPATGQRILANYTILSDKPESSGYDHDVKLNSAYDILTKEVKEVTEENEDEFGDDPLNVTDIWIGSDYLNVEFNYAGYNKTHFLSLVHDGTKTYEDGKTHLELRHNAYDDEKRYRYSGMASFLLEKLKSTSTSELELVIHVTDYEGNEKTYPRTYRFDGKNTDKDFDEDDYDENNGDISVE